MIKAKKTIADRVAYTQDGRFDLEQCEKESVEIDQDWENETTTYTFEDGSSVIYSNNDVEIVEG